MVQVLESIHNPEVRDLGSYKSLGEVVVAGILWWHNLHFVHRRKSRERSFVEPLLPRNFSASAERDPKRKKIIIYSHVNRSDPLLVLLADCICARCGNPEPRRSRHPLPDPDRHSRNPRVLAVHCCAVSRTKSAVFTECANIKLCMH